ncbi:hypothetical protein CUMW_254970 [Citrus unshiu]|uniref:Uncharacterized protein n=1 Tax=Citrus unshiu TaxID=55188 RepID=A0A2H5QRI5_CITUN|nr:hypothetical protein CUMW_254970 [Citrus unshiu]
MFSTKLIANKPIGIQIFPNCTKVIGSKLPDKDILLGFYIIQQIKHLQILSSGIRVKTMLKPYIEILKLFDLTDSP